MLAAHRRLAGVHAALAATETTSTVLDDVEVGTPEWDALCWELSQGTLDTSTVSPRTIRALMLTAEGATETERILATWEEQYRDLGLGEPPRPLIDVEAGSVTEEQLGWLRSLREKAVADEDFRRAAYIHSLYEIIRPRAPLTLQDCAPQGVEAKAEFFLRNGFVCVENVLTGNVLARCQEAWQEWEQPSMEAWLDARRHNFGIARHSFAGAEEGHPTVARKWFGITGLSYNTDNVNPVAKPFLQLDTAFIDLIHNDSSPGSDEVWQVAEQVLCGPGPPGTFSQTYGGILTVILPINDVPCCWKQVLIWSAAHRVAIGGVGRCGALAAARARIRLMPMPKVTLTGNSACARNLAGPLALSPKGRSA